MISWMQKHRKYLVVTIWVSTIAFVGAGFVGWGSLDFSGNSSNAAKVGDREISLKELNHEYSRLFNFYNQMMGGSLDNQKAKELKIEDQAMNNLIVKAVLLNYAKELGFYVADSEVSKKIASMEYFLKDGKFDKELYIQKLSQSGFKPADFEEEMKKEILIQKVADIINLKLTPFELDSIASFFYMQNSISVDVIDGEKLNIITDEKSIKDFWEQNRLKYTNPPQYTISVIKTSINSIDINESEIENFYQENRVSYTKDGKILELELAKERVIKDLKLKKAKSEALQTYLNFKKGNINGDEVKVSSLDSNSSYEMPFMLALEDTKVGDYIKPIEISDGYLVAKLLKKDEATTKSFEEAKKDAESDLKESKIAIELQNEAKKGLENFNGRAIGYVSRDDIDKIKELNESENVEFLAKLFETKDKKGYIIVNKKAVLYDIIEQKLFKQDSSKDMKFLEESSQKLKSGIIEQALLNELKNRYETKLYYRGN